MRNITQIPTFRNYNYRLQQRIKRLKRQIGFDRLIILSMLVTMIFQHWLVYLLLGMSVVLLSVAVIGLINEIKRPTRFEYILSSTPIIANKLNNELQTTKGGRDV